LNEVGQKIAKEIERQGVIPFARFMELALYCPVYGYYEKEQDIIGVAGDFYTSVSVGSLFGELLAFQFAAWLAGWEANSAQNPVKIAEAGAHDGRLASDILAWFREYRPELFQRLEYWIIEPSPARRETQQRRLAPFASSVRWTNQIQELGRTPTSPGIRGIVFSNEFLDALPVRRVAWNARERRWFEWGVASRGEQFVWSPMDHDPDDAVRLVRELHLPEPEDSNGKRHSSAGRLGMPVSPALLAALPDEFTLEIGQAAEQWWRQAAEALEWGALVAIDYGMSAEEFLVPERSDGTLRGYRRQRAVNDVLAAPGEQDLTAHVNFTRIEAVGRAAGLLTEQFDSQAKFLTRTFALLAQHPELLAGWTGKQTRQFQTLTHPEHLGRPFRVLVQSRF
jgi:SAM-dependent MidA family methyltransferase